jgi:hypothetical protein
MAANINRTIGAFFDSSQGRLRRIGGYIGPSSYVTGGDAFLPADVAMGRIEHLDISNALDAAGANMRILVWNSVTQKVMWFVSTTGVEVANGVDVSGFAARFEAIGQ